MALEEKCFTGGKENSVLVRAGIRVTASVICCATTAVLDLSTTRIHREFEQEKKIFERIEKAFDSGSAYQSFPEEEQSPAGGGGAGASQWRVWKRRIYLFLEEPSSSLAAQVSTAHARTRDHRKKDLRTREPDGSGHVATFTTRVRAARA